MYNWSVDEQRFKKKDPKGYKLWRLTQLINYGLDGEKLSRKEVKKAWPKIKDRLDPLPDAKAKFDWHIDPLTSWFTNEKGNYIHRFA